MAEEAENNRGAVFDRLFAGGSDPWDLQNSEYERAKRAATLAALGNGRFRHALEVGCAYGLLTEQLARRCDRVLALDISEVALARARARLEEEDRITLMRAEVPADWPEGQFDCMIWSEVLYFLSAAEIEQCSDLARHALLPGGVCVLVNWTGANDLPVSGEEATNLFIASAWWTSAKLERAENYRLDVLRALG